MKLNIKKIASIFSTIGIVLFVMGWFNYNPIFNITGLIFIFTSSVLTYIITRTNASLISLFIWVLLILSQSFIH